MTKNQPIHIESAQNDTFKKLLSLTTSKGLKEEKLFLLSGEKLIREFLENPTLKIAYEITTSHTTLTNAPCITLTTDLFNQLDVLGTHFNILVLEQPALETVSAESLIQTHGIEVALPTGDPGNLGALLRSCEAFGVRRVVLTREAAHPFLPKCVKASAGSVLRMPLVRTGALADLPDNAVALDMGGTPIDQFTWPENILLAVGEEGPGFGARQFKNCISIPTKTVESLNVVVAASIVLSRLPQK